VAFPQLSWRNHARYSPPVFPPAPGQPAEWETLLLLASIASGKHAGRSAAEIDGENFADDARMRFGESAAAVIEATAALRGPDRLLDLVLRSGPYGDQFGRKPDGLNLARVQGSTAAGGIDLGPLAPRIPDLLRTPSGRIELAPPALLADLQRARADLQRAPAGMVVIGRRDVRSNNSWMHNLPVLAKGPMRCTALVHPADAQRLGLRDGAMARISSHTPRGPRSIEVMVECSIDMMPGVVSVPHGWGHNLPGTRQTLASSRAGANLNALLDEDLRDPLSGNAVLSGVAVELCALD
jgi:anaerobic selenocysteine-containing dehydrogenase